MHYSKKFCIVYCNSPFPFLSLCVPFIHFSSLLLLTINMPFILLHKPSPVFIYACNGTLLPPPTPLPRCDRHFYLYRFVIFMYEYTLLITFYLCYSPFILNICDSTLFISSLSTFFFWWWVSITFLGKYLMFLLVCYFRLLSRCFLFFSLPLLYFFHLISESHSLTP